MKIFITTIIIIASFAFTCNSQTIEIKKLAFGNYSFWDDGNELTLSQLSQRLEANMNATKVLKFARIESYVVNAFAFSGSFLIGYPLGVYIGKGNLNLTMLGVGASLIALSVPLYINTTKRAKKAVDIYNKNIDETSTLGAIDLKFAVTDGKIGLILKF